MDMVEYVPLKKFTRKKNLFNEGIFKRTHFLLKIILVQRLPQRSVGWIHFDYIILILKKIIYNI